MSLTLRQRVKRLPMYDLLQRMRQRRDYREWDRHGRPGSPPHAVKQSILREYANRFGLRVLVETGTCAGDMIAALRRQFDTIYSVELDHALWEAARYRFGRFPQIHILEGDSQYVIPNILREIQQACLFWLDGHYSGGVTAKGERETPILQELRHVFSHVVKDHVILIDDARCFTGENDYPTLKALEVFVRQERPDYRMKVEQDIIRIHQATS